MNGIVLSGVIMILAASMTIGAAEMSPAKGWRVIPSEVVSSSGDPGELLSGNDGSWEPALSRSEWIAFKVPNGKRFLLTFACGQSKPPVYAVLERSLDSTDGRNGYWQTMGVLLPKAKLDKFAFDRGCAEWWRLRFAFKYKEEPSEFKVSDIGLYSLDDPGRKDYWLTIGASIQAQSIRNGVFKAMVRERYPGYDPVMFNLAVGGWRTHHLLAALPKFLEDHLEASYVCIHIGGNNVSPNRPYPGGADLLRTELTSILEMVRDSGKIPILSRLSYRAYKGNKPVPPEDNGSGPYVTAIFDPLIKEYSPAFYDFKDERGLVDGYTWFREHPEELSADGVHVNPQGAESWNRLWAEHAGGVIYGKKTNK